MFSHTDLEALQTRHPQARFFIHNGLNGATHDSPLNPTAITLDTACRLLNLLGRVQPEEELRQQLAEEPPAIEYARAHSYLHRVTRGHRFLAFLPPELCSYRDDDTGHPAPPPADLTPIDLALPAEPPWFAERKIDVVWILLALVVFASSIVIPYLEGRANGFWAISFFSFLLLPLVFLPACLTLLTISIRSLFRRRHLLANTGLFLFSILLPVARYKIPSGDLFYRGFVHYARTVLTPDEWREIARFTQAHKMPESPDNPGSGHFPTPQETRDFEAKQKAYEKELADTTPYRKLHNYPRIYVTPEQTSIYWGGALSGHRYIVIFTHEGQPLPLDIFRGTFITGDIAAYLSED